MTSLTILIAFSGHFLGLASAVGTPTCSQVTTMSSSLLETMLATDTTVSLHALALRLGFHDCVGGCNGCINFDNSDNAGLEDVVDGFTSLYYSEGYDDIVSLADFYALATTVAIRNAVQISNNQRSGSTSSPCTVPCFSMQWGRTDVSDCSDDDSELPSGTMTGDEMFTYFADEFGFSRDQVVALMGAHSFGGAKTSNSGYSGKWTGSQNKGLSEVYYSNMISSSITFSNVNAGNSSVPKYQFTGKLSNGTAAGFMLNTDFELYYNLTLNSNAKTTCTLSNTCGLTNSCTNYCAKATTFSTAYSYSQDCDTFMTDFMDVITLMLANGYSDSDLETTTCTCS